MLILILIQKLNEEFRTFKLKSPGFYKREIEERRVSKGKVKMKCTLPFLSY